ncbi:MAG: hypothetical protein HN590_14050 [Calditrichaeota bacterium]|jgi:hypothetical protein|nr:hypothetical protein [Calditrichota bacterium]
MNIQNTIISEGAIEMVDNEIPEVDVDQLIDQVELLRDDEGVTEVKVNLKHRRSLLVGNKRKVCQPSWNGSLEVTTPRITGGDEDKFRCGR